MRVQFEPQCGLRFENLSASTQNCELSARLAALENINLLGVRLRACAV